MRRFVSVWLPEFAIERLRRQVKLTRSGAGSSGCARRPEARAPKPVPFAIAETGPRGAVLFAVNAAARQAGVQPGLTVSDAKAICPRLITKPAERDHDARVLMGLARWLGRYGPNRNVDGADGLWVEITGVAHLFNGERRLVADLTARLEGIGFRARAGVGETYAAAHGLARYGCEAGERFAIAETGTANASLAALPADALRLSDDSLLLLKRLGLRRIGQVHTIPRPALARRFRDDVKAGRKKARDHCDGLARAVVWRLDQMFGESDEPKVPLEPPPVRQKRQSFPEPLISNDGVVAAVRDLSRCLSADLVATGVGSLELRLAVYRSDGTVATLGLALARPSGDPEHIFKLFEMRLPELDIGLGADVIVLEALRVAPLEVRQRRFGPAAQAADRSAAVSDLVDRLTTRLGADRVWRVETHASHIPERAFRVRSALAAVADDLEKPPLRSDSSTIDAGAMTAMSPRPQLLLEQPEPIEVLAELPEGPPAQFRWRRRRCRVHRASGPERIAPEWWRALEVPTQDDAERATDDEIGEGGNNPAGSFLVPRTGPRPRDYYVLEDSAGGRYWVFRDGLYQLSEAEGPPAWYLHGLFT